jgi:hypothetical protein
MSHTDEAVLWDGYNRLSKLVAPATDESLEIADQIRQARPTYPHDAETWPIVARVRRELRKIVQFLITMVAIFLVTQAYVIVLTDVLEDHKSLREEHRSILTQIQTLRAANPNLKEEAAPLKPLLDRHAELENKMTVSSRTEAHLMAMWWWVYPKPDGMDGARGSDAAEGILVRMFAVEDYVVAFLMGYSVEFAFSLFDRAIERGRALLKPEARSSEPTDSGQAAKKT